MRYIETFAPSYPKGLSMKTKKFLVIGLMSTLLVSLMTFIAAPANAVDAKGRACAQEGLLRTISGITYTCERNSGGLVYGAGRKLSGSLTVVCGATEAWCGAMTAAFERKTGVSTKFVRLSSGETTARLEAFKSNPEFGVWHGGPVDGFGVARIKGLIDSYNSPSRNMIPAKYKDADGFWTGVYVGALGFCSNTEVLKKLGVPVPKSWAALLDSRLKSNISTAHPATSGTAFTTLWTQVTRLGSQDAALGYMKEFHKNVLFYTKSGVGPVGIVGRGEAAVGLVFSHDCVFGIEQGNPLVVSFPSEGTGFEIGGVALIKGAKNPDAAKAYIDFTLSADAQNLGVGVGAYQILTNPRSRKDPRMVKLAKLVIVDYDFDKAAAAKTALTAKFDAEIIARTQVKG